MKLLKVVPELSVAGIVGAYTTWTTLTGTEGVVDPLVVAVCSVLVFFALSLYRAWADDGKITFEEIAEILGVSLDELDSAVVDAKRRRPRVVDLRPQQPE